MQYLKIQKCNSIWLIVLAVCLWLYIVIFEILIHPTFTKMIAEAQVTEWQFNIVIGKFMVKYSIIIACILLFYTLNNRKVKNETGGNVTYSIIISSTINLMGVVWFISTFTTVLQSAITVPYIVMRNGLLNDQVNKLKQGTLVHSAAPGTSKPLPTENKVK